MGYDSKTVELGSRKHVFIDWDLIEPGYGLSFGGERPESWEMPHGLRLPAPLPRLRRATCARTLALAPQLLCQPGTPGTAKE